jgi:hypothetical protein
MCSINQSINQSIDFFRPEVEKPQGRLEAEVEERQENLLASILTRGNDRLNKKCLETATKCGYDRGGSNVHWQ